MGLINQDIKNLVSGISQQPPILRHPEQLEEQLNGFSSEAAGLQKRPPTLFSAMLTQKNNTHNKPLIHFINRDENEKYAVIFTGSDVEVYDLQGKKYTVNYKNNSKPYLFTQSPRRKLKVITIADYTFVVNTNQEVSMSQKKSPNVWDSQGLLVNIKSGQYGRTYRIDVNGEIIASFETPDGSDKSHTKQIATDNIVNQLATKCEEKGYTVTKGSSWLYVNKVSKVTSRDEDVTLRPSTTPKQQYDRFMGLRNDYISVPFYNLKEGQQRVSIKGSSIIIEGIIGKGAYDSGHFEGSGQAMMDEIERCRADNWTIKEEEFNSQWVHNTYKTKRFTLTYTTTSKPNVETIDKTDIKSFSVYDGYNNQAAFGIMRTVQKFTNLPSTAPNGFVVKIAGEQGSQTDDYYVEYDDKDKIWKETVRPGLSDNFSLNTLPHVLVREADGTFTFREGEWDFREIGDDDSNPLPSFVDQTINDVFYFRNRLGFLSGENVILSRSADFFNFWMSSAIEVQDTDPIDLASSDNSITTLYSAVPFDAELIVFGEDAQFSLQTSSVLSPKDAYLTPPLTHFGASLKAQPVNSGRNIYFTAERSQYTTVREYFTATDNTESKDAQDITSHVPSYIPNGVYKLIGSSIENILLCLTEGEEDAMYVYKYLFIDGQRQQAAWSKWDFGSKIYGAAFVDNYLYIVIERNGHLCLERMSFTFNTTDIEGEPYRVLLDSKLSYKVPTAAYDPLTEETTIDLHTIYGDTYDTNSQYSIVTNDGVYEVADKGVVKLQGNYAETLLTVGINYMFRITLSTIMVKKDTDSGITSLNEGRLQLRQGWFNYSDSGYFKVVVKLSDKDKYTYEFTSRLLGTLSNVLGSMPFTTGTFKFPIQSLNTNCQISLETDSPLPISLIGAGWLGNYVRRSRLLR